MTENGRKTTKDIKEIYSLMSGVSSKDKEIIEKAYKFAESAHRDQKRKSGEPYWNHLFETAKNLAELDMSATTIAAGFLHDSIEDVGISRESIGKEFGKEILFIVDGVTKLGKIRYHGADRHNESMRKLFVAMSQDIRVLIVKLCDRLHNIETLEYVSREKQDRIARETLEIYAPIAYRLGIRKLSRKLEDLSFPYVYPEEYREIESLVKEKYYDRTEILEKFRKAVAKELAKSGFGQFKTDYRIKGLYSLYKKYLKMDRDIEKIYDIAAMRVILKNQEDCYKALGLIHSHWQPLPGRIKDYIAFPKENGYQGLHTTVFTGDGGVVEVQIKTEEMHRRAEYGIASHISYKSGDKRNPGLDWVRRILPKPLKEARGNIKENIKDIPEWIMEMANYQNENKQNEKYKETLDDIKEDFFSERIFVFTPKGDCIDLPQGASAIDFAYAVHSDIGNHMAGVKINGKLSTLGIELKSGNIVEIITKESARPNRKWLDYAKTTLAKKNIRNFI